MCLSVKNSLVNKDTFLGHAHVPKLWVRNNESARSYTREIWAWNWASAEAPINMKQTWCICHTNHERAYHVPTLFFCMRREKQSGNKTNIKPPRLLHFGNGLICHIQHTIAEIVLPTKPWLLSALTTYITISADLLQCVKLLLLIHTQHCSTQISVRQDYSKNKSNPITWVLNVVSLPPHGERACFKLFVLKRSVYKYRMYRVKISS